MRVYVSAWVGAGNLGDELLFKCLLRRLQSCGVDEISTASLNPKQTREHFGVTAHSYRNIFSTVREIARSDFFILGPGGILQDDTSPWSLPYQLFKPLLAKLFGKPVLGMGLGAGPLRRPSSAILIRKVLQSARLIVVRDVQSAELLREAGLTRLKVTADLALAESIDEQAPEQRIAVCLRPHRKGGANVPVMFQSDELNDDYITAMAAALDTLATRLAMPCHFVAFEPHRDHPLHLAVAARMSTEPTLSQPTVDELIGEVGRCRAVVAMRFHSAIAAILTLRPAVMIGYAPKVKSLAERLGKAFRYIPNDPTSFPRLADELEQALRHDVAELAGRRAEMRQAEAQNAEILQKFLDGASQAVD